MLYERLLGADNLVKIPVHAFQATLAEYARGQLTGAEAQAIISAVSGEPLSPEDVAEAQALLATFTGDTAAKLARAAAVDHVLLLADHRAPGYSTPQEIRTRVGV